MIQPKETIYGSYNRYKWFKKFLNKDQKIIDLGCGTGSMITIPLIAEGYDILGLDLDQKSINYGKQLLEKNKLNTDLLACFDFATISFVPDVVILSEVLEHIKTGELEQIISLVFKKLKPGGLLLITVPNGYGIFEWESFLWYKLKLGKLLEKLYIVETIVIIKNKLIGDWIEDHPSSLDTSGHVQRFTYNSLEKLLHNSGFVTKENNWWHIYKWTIEQSFFHRI
ncbi:MAG: class I SAM-dependent methyltransferase [Candidatus Babeliales bacterium]